MPLPLVTDVIASTTPYSIGIFNLLLPWGLAMAGILIGGLFVLFLVRSLKGGIAKITGGGRRGGSRRRRR